jgi:hypothetical protein
MSSKEIEVGVSDLINRKYRDYSMYVIMERAIPSLIDGFKPVHRKAFYLGQKLCRNEKMKVASLAGALPMSCLSGDTVVIHNGIERRIDEVAKIFKPGDKIFAYNEREKLFEECLLLNAFKSKDVKETIVIELENGEIIELTGDHLVLLTNGKWVRADELTELDEITSLDK